MSEPARRWAVGRAPGGWTSDAALAGVLLALLVVEIVPNPDMTPHAALIALSVPMTVPLAWRQRWSGTAAVTVCTAHMVTSMVATGEFAPQQSIFPVLVAIFSAASRLREDQQLVREGIVTMLGVRDDFEVVAEAGDGARAVSEAVRTRPDVALVDIRMPVLDGIEATRRIVAELPDTKVLVLTPFGSDDLVFAALAAGASGFLLKDVRAEALLEAVGAVAHGQGRLDPSVTGAVVGHFRDHGPVRSADSPELARLTEREREVLLLLARGLSNAEIAAALFVAPGTVKTHVGTVLAKLGVRDRVQAVILAYESGLMRP